jgi:hypothetical protein
MTQEMINARECLLRGLMEKVKQLGSALFRKKIAIGTEMEGRSWNGAEQRIGTNGRPMRVDMLENTG